MDIEKILKIISAVAGIGAGLAEVALSSFKLKAIINGEDEEVDSESEES